MASLPAEIRTVPVRRADEADGDRLAHFCGLQFGTLSRHQQPLQNARLTICALQKTARARHA